MDEPLFGTHLKEAKEAIKLLFSKITSKRKEEVMKLFQFAVILNPTEKEQEDGKTAKLIVSITTVLANDQSQATLQAGRAIPEEYLEKLDRIEVAVRPF